jgi:hypothetical protein
MHRYEVVIDIVDAEFRGWHWVGMFGMGVVDCYL